MDLDWRSLSFPFSFLSSQVLKGPAQVTEHPQSALELASGHRVRVLTSFPEKQSYVFDALGDLALGMWDTSWCVFLPGRARYRPLLAVEWGLGEQGGL